MPPLDLSSILLERVPVERVLPAVGTLLSSLTEHDLLQAAMLSSHDGSSMATPEPLPDGGDDGGFF